MWRLLFFVVTPLWGEDVFTEEKDSGYLERRLDDDKVLDDVVVRWRIRGSEKVWKQLRVYQRLDWKPREGQAFFGLVKRDLGEVIVGDLRPDFGAGVVCGRERRGSINATVPTTDSTRL